jgi:ATP-dependent Clp protease adaptor protein ClpS
MSFWKGAFEHQFDVEEIQKTQIEKPPMYSVWILNDDYTPMDFVVDVLCKFFNMNTEQATDVMLTVHYQGKAKCGTYTAEVAETKVDNVSRYAVEHQHPLRCVMEKSE